MDASHRRQGAALPPFMGAAATMLAPTRPPPLPVRLPMPPPRTPPSTPAATDAALDALAAAAPRWAATPLRERAAVLRAAMATTVAASRAGAEAAVSAKGSYGTGCGEEWVGWMAVVWALRVVRGRGVGDAPG